MPYSPRHIDRELQAWSRSPRRKPLILRGARQTGKTAAIRNLGRSFDLYQELNLEHLRDRRLLELCDSPQELITTLLTRQGLSRAPPRTLLFLDEIQASPKAVHMLRYFYEEMPEIAVAAAGSLLEVRLARTDFSFPVGRVNFRHLHPMSFFEFLEATHQAELARRLERCAREGTGATGGLHELGMRALHDYLWVGGMPEAVSRWAEDRSPAAVREVQNDIQLAFEDDLSKYGAGPGLEDLQSVFLALPDHVGLRFKYERLCPGVRAESARSALDLLGRAMIVRLAEPTCDLRPPHFPRPKVAPKLLPLDVGLALAGMDLPYQELRSASLDELRDGRVAEIFVAQQIVAQRLRHDPALRFWVAEGGAEAELDLLLNLPTGPLPVEVKSGRQGTLRSLHRYLQRSGQREGLRLWASGQLDEEHEVKLDGAALRYRLRSWPLYLAEMIEPHGDEDDGTSESPTEDTRA